MSALKRQLALVVALVTVAGSGLLVKAQLPQAVGTWTDGGHVSARIASAAVTLPDGRTLIVAGRNAETPTSEVLVYDAASGTTTVAGNLVAARTGHTAVLLKDGRVLVAGGLVNGEASADIEIFDPAAGTSSIVGGMLQARTALAAARLADETVIIVGGAASGGAATGSAERFDPATGSVVPAGALNVPRLGASATTLLDGRVVVAGGSDGVAELRSAEIYTPYLDSFSTLESELSTARSGHIAFLLPNNGSLMIAGGVANGEPQAAVDLYLPAEFPDPYSYSVSSFSPAAPMAAGRADAIAGASALEGHAFVSGGGASNAEIYRFPTIRTDKDDYAPGQQAVITGTGWEAGEVVTLRFQEDPGVHDDYVLTVTADGEGRIYWDQWAPEQHDLGVRFYLIARGETSGRVAQTTFTDGQPRIIAVSPGIFSASQASSLGVLDSTSITAKNQGGGNLTGFEVRIRDSAGNLVRTLPIGNVNANAEPTVSWNGRDGSNSVVPDGQYLVRAFANGAGENEAANDSRIVTVDNTNPTVTLTSPADGATVPATFNLVAAPLDAGGDDENVARVEFYVDGNLEASDPNGNNGWQTSVTPSGGNHTWFVRVFDAAGNNVQSPTRTFTLNTDNSAPVITSNVAGTLGTNGWYRSDVTITWTVSDPDSAISSTTGCDEVNVTADTDGTTYTCSATSAGGTASDSVTIKRDASAPNAPSAVRTPAANPAGWNNTNVTVTFEAAGDNGPSGIASCSSPSTFTEETSGTTASGTCTDMAGNEGPGASVIVRIDITAPVITGSRTPAANSFGWNNTDVTVSFACADQGTVISGLATNDVAGTTVENETSGLSVTNTGTCVDNAGNVANSSTVSDIRIDKTAPAAPTGSRSPEANAAGWNNQSPVIVSFSAQGDLGSTQSGVDGCTTSESVTAETTGTSIAGTCRDRAGNLSVETVVVVKIDLTKPVITGHRSPLANPHGWNNTDVAVSFTCADDGTVQSGIESDTVAGATVSSEGENQSVTNTGACVDVAGNSAIAATVGGINIDKTAPTISGNLDRAPAATGWFNIATGSPKAQFTCSDPLSGIADGPCPFETAPLGEGAAQSVSHTATDRAGNTASTSITGINVDLTAPSVVITSPSNTSYVLNAVAQAAYTCTDGLSGPGSCIGPVASGSAFNTSSVGPKTFAVSAVDTAGNPGSGEVGYNVVYATGPCLGSPSRQILEPVNADGSSIFKQKSTVPSKFRVCDANGVSIGTPGVVTGFALTAVYAQSTELPINEAIVSTTPDTTFRWSASDQQWIFNLSTKNLTAGRTYTYTVYLNDGTEFSYGFTLK